MTVHRSSRVSQSRIGISSRIPFDFPYRRPSPSARPAEHLKTRDALWSIFIQWNAQYGRVSPSQTQLLDLKWKTVHEAGGFLAATRADRFQNVADRLFAEYKRTASK